MELYDHPQHCKPPAQESHADGDRGRLEDLAVLLAVHSAANLTPSRLLFGHGHRLLCLRLGPLTGRCQIASLNFAPHHGRDDFSAHSEDAAPILRAREFFSPAFSSRRQPALARCARLASVSVFGPDMVGPRDVLLGAARKEGLWASTAH